MIISTIEFIGNWYTFAPEWVDYMRTGSHNLSFANPIHLWVYLVFMNSLWVVIPGLLIWDSGKILVAAVAGKKVVPTPTAVWQCVAGLLITYAIAIPAVLATAK